MLKQVLPRLSVDWILSASLEDLHRILEWYLPVIGFDHLTEYVLRHVRGVVRGL